MKIDEQFCAGYYSHRAGGDGLGLSVVTGAIQCFGETTDEHGTARRARWDALYSLL
jgi:hypothetical protein